jgi:LPXTG-site transpeptidase (sortase) family protein
MYRKILLSIFNFWSFILTSLDRTTGKRVYVLIAMGLGLGIGMAISFYRFPPVVSAFPTQVNNQQIKLEIERISSPTLGLDVTVKSGSMELLPLVKLAGPAVHVVNSATIGQGQAIVIQGTKADYSFYNLDQVQLGQEILVQASNGGLYRYRTVETKLVTYDQLSTTFAQNSETLILFTTNSFNQTANVVIARPLR